MASCTEVLTIGVLALAAGVSGEYIGDGLATTAGASALLMATSPPWSDELEDESSEPSSFSRMRALGNSVIGSGSGLDLMALCFGPLAPALRDHGSPHTDSMNSNIPLLRCRKP